MTTTLKNTFASILALEPDSGSFHVEEQVSMLIKKYHGIPVDMSRYSLTKKDPMEFVDYVYRMFAMLMYKQPLRHELTNFLVWFEHYDTAAQGMVLAYIQEQNEYKYITECLDHFQGLQVPLSLTIPPRRASNDGSQRFVKYYGPIGTSGYAVACRDIVSSIVMEGALDLFVEFVPLTVQNYGYSEDEATRILSYMTPSYRGTDPYRGNTPDIVIIHAVPDMIPAIARMERERNEFVTIVGITVWETDAIPPQWEGPLTFLDEVWTPNAWNAATIARDVAGLVAKSVHHPVVIPEVVLEGGEAPLLATVAEHKARGDYVFYTINEFSGRKGIDILIRSYLKAFTGADSVVLVIKTHGNVSEDLARRYIARHSTATSAPILLDYTRWSDADIHRLHRLGDAFVSFTRSEGHGLGACHAGLHGKHVIMTGYGGQLDYLTGIEWVPYTLVPASFCSPFDPSHAKCVGKPWCRHFPFFIPALQRWGLVSDADAVASLKSAFDLRKQGSPDTVHQLRFRFGPAGVGFEFTKAIKAAVPARPRATLSRDPYDLPEAVFAPQAPFTDVFLPATKKRVLIVACSGSGNFGDDMYERLHMEELGGDYDITIIHPTRFIDINGTVQNDDEVGPMELMPFDHVVIGGGGVINKGEVRSSVFRRYFPYCVANGIPISLISVGVGLPGESRQLDIVTRQAWASLLEYASLVSVRSHFDANLVRDLMSPHRHHRVKVAADVVYKIAETPVPTPTHAKRYVVFCPTNFMSVRFPDVVDLLRRRLWENPGARLVFLPLNGHDPDVYPSPTVVDELAIFRQFFPDAIMYTGRIGKLADPEVATWRSMQIALTLDDVINFFRNAVHVVTGRYHGLVAARAFGVPYDIGTANLAKLVNEADTVLTRESWRKHYDELRFLLDAPEVYEDKDPDLWTEDERNTAIIDEVTQPAPGAWFASVGYTQGLSNEDLRERRMVAKSA